MVLFADESRSNLGAETTEVNMMLYEVLACGLCYSDTNMLSGRDCCGSVQLGSPAGAALPAAPRSSYCAIRACLHNDNNTAAFPMMTPSQELTVISHTKNQIKYY